MIEILNTKTVLLAVLGGILPAVLWLWFWLKEDRKNPEPKRVVIITFILGGLAVYLAFYLEQHFASGFDLSTLENLTVDFSSWPSWVVAGFPLLYLFFGWALIEEFLKYLAALLGAFHSKAFDEPVDAMIYMISAALGFAAVENSLFLLKTVRLGLTGFDFMLNGNLRFLGATLLHVFSSAIVGAFIALSLSERGGRRIWKTLLGLLVATLLHALFNFFILNNGGQSIFYVLSTLWVSVLGIFLIFEKIKKIKTPYVQR